MIPNRLAELSRGYRASRVLLSAVELDLFARLGPERLDAGAIAERLGTDLRATETLLEALVALELLDETADGYGNVAAYDVLWDADRAHDRRGLENASALWEVWSGLTDIVRRGRAEDGGRVSQDDEGCASRIRQLSFSHTEPIAAAIDWGSVRRMLDVGGGTGVHAIGLARRYPQLNAVVFDSSPAALRIAAADIRRQVVAERVVLRQGDVLHDDLGDGYDAVLASSLLCLMDEPEALRLLRRIASALNDRGVLIVYDLMLDGARAARVPAALFNVHLLLTSPRGRCRRRSEVEGWIRDAGFTAVRTQPVGAATLVVGTRTVGAGGR